VPDGLLNVVSLGALPAAGTTYLVDEGPVIHYVSSERDLAAGPATRPDAGRGLLAIGGPAYGDASTFSSLGKRPQRPATEAATNHAGSGRISEATPSSYHRRDTECGSFESLRFAALPATLGEAEDVRQIWEQLGRPAFGQDEEARSLTGGAATERAVKQLTPGIRILHLATHGFVLDGECSSGPVETRAVGGVASGPARTSRPRQGVDLPDNPLLLSGLAFAGANRRSAAGPDDEDGILTAEEVVALDLRGLEWAVLSACETGLGEIRSGEGVFGLRRAFQIAGARTVIMSLWSVDDRSTRDWMRGLYEARLGRRLNTADAVRSASLTVLRARRAKGQSTHPFYWAAFVAAGDWR
jgi:CHAT domain-containing protein